MKNSAQSTIRETSFARLLIARLITTIVFLLFSSPSFTTDKDYLRSLENESNSSPGAKSSNLGTDNNYLDALTDEAESSAKVPTSLGHNDAYYQAMKKMEAHLKNKKPSTYKFYIKLSPKNQTRIFDHYASDNSDSDTRLSHLKKQVMDTYFKK